MDPDLSQDDSEVIDATRATDTDITLSNDTDSIPAEAEQSRARECSLNKLQAASGIQSSSPSFLLVTNNETQNYLSRKPTKSRYPEAVIVLKEEKVIRLFGSGLGLH